MVIWEELRFELLFLHIKRHMYELGYLIWEMPLGHPLDGVWTCPTERRPQTCWRDYISHLAWESLSAPSHPWSSWRRWLRRGSVCSDSCPDDLDADNHQKMNGWLFPEQCFYFFTISIHKALFDLDIERYHVKNFFWTFVLNPDFFRGGGSSSVSPASLSLTAACRPLPRC